MEFFIQRRSQAARSEIVDKAQKQLGLEGETASTFTMILKTYQKNKQKVLQLSRSGKRPFFDQRYLNMLAELKQTAMADLKQALSPSQMQAFSAQGLDPGPWPGRSA